MKCLGIIGGIIIILSIIAFVIIIKNYINFND